MTLPAQGDHGEPLTQSARWLDDVHATSVLQDLARLDRMTARIAASSPPGSIETVLDLGCGTGAAVTHVARALQIPRRHGVDVDSGRLERAAELGVITHHCDLDRDRVPLEDGSVDLVTSFGAIEHLVWLDHFLDEVARVLRPGGWFLLAAPNLGSWINRFALLFGYQPRDVEVSQRAPAGILPIYRDAGQLAPLGHVHSVTLRAMRQLVERHDLSVQAVAGTSPYPRRLTRLADAIFARIPSWSRRYLLLARRADTG
ncbi:MAG: methyltransferase domain-containing protein [Nitriliruptorales bacterium]|nr:methyltransferase domain-containing protein [Nitriliruptorales bacterium]